METQNKQHPSAVHLAALTLGKLKPDTAAEVQSHLDECGDCRSFVSDTPRAELADIIKQAKHEAAAEQNTMATGFSGTVASLQIFPQGVSPQEVVSKTPPASPPSSITNRIEHAVGEDEIPHDLFAQSKYRILRVLGRGGMGTVYEAEHVRMKRPVAIKVINLELVNHPQALAQFEKEIRAVASLDHANIARAFDAENIGSLQAFIMEFVRGQTLYDFLRSRGRLSILDACRSVWQALVGLQHAHQQGLVHRDLKPQNLMLTQDTGQIKILDFGLAKAVSENRQSRGLTSSRATMGTYAYMAPEQALDAANADIRADIYSLGCTLYLLISGVLPFDYDVDTKLLLAHQNESPRPLHAICPEVPEALSNLVTRMLAKNPADRPQTPREAADALLPFARGKSDLSPATTASGAQPIVNGRSRNGWKRVCIAAAIIALFGFGSWAVGLFSLRTEHGTIIVDNVPQDAQVSVDGHKVTVTRSGDSLAISAMERGSHHLVLTQNGHDLWTNDVAVGVAGQLVRVKFEPADRPNVTSNTSVSPPAENAQTTTASPTESKPTGEPKSELESADAQRETAAKFPLYSHWTGQFLPQKREATASVIKLEGNTVVLEVRAPNSPTRQFRCAVDHEHVTVLTNDAIGDRPDGSPASISSNIKIAGTIIGGQLSLSGTQALWDPKRRVNWPNVHFKLTLQREDSDSTSSQASSSKAAQKLDDSLSTGSVWEGKRFYRKGAWEKESERYLLHVTSREGEKFNGHVFSRGPQKNQAEVEGEISGSSIRWEERLDDKTVAVQGTIHDAGKIIQLTFHGTWKDRVATTDGDGELTLDPKPVAVENK